MKLTTEQSVALDELTQLNKKYREARRTAHAEAMRAAEDRIEAVRLQMDLLVRECFETGVPKSQIGKYGLNTTAPVTVNDSLARTEALAEAQRSIQRRMAAHDTTTAHASRTPHTLEGAQAR